MALHVLLVSFLNVVLDPVPELLAQPGVDHVGDPLARQQMDLLLVGEITHQLGVLPGLLEHALDREILVLGAVNLSVLVRLDAYSC